MPRRSLLLALLSLLVLAAPAAASTTQVMRFESPRDLKDPRTRTASLDEMQRLGVDEVRVVLYWRDVAPKPTASRKPDFDTTDPAGYAWGEYDALLNDVKARGMKTLLTVSGPVPRWATESKKDQITRPEAAEFAQFMTAVGRHFASRVATWSIWNEPNQPQFLLPQYDSKLRPLSPPIYRALYKAALRGLASAKVPSPKVLIGETSPRRTGKVVGPVTFLRGMLCLNSRNRMRKGCGKLAAAGVAHHAYTTSAGPRFVPPRDYDITIGALGRLTSLLDRAAKAGALPARLPIHVTEFGIQSFPDRTVGVSLQRQEEYRALSERIAYENPRVAAFSQYLLRDDDPRPGPIARRYSGFETGLRFANGKAKPSLDGFRLVLSAVRRGSTVSLWGRIRPATGATTARLEYRSGGAGSWRPLTQPTTTARGVFRARTKLVANRQYRVTWTSPSGAALSGAAIRPLK